MQKFVSELKKAKLKKDVLKVAENFNKWLESEKYTPNTKRAKRRDFRKLVLSSPPNKLKWFFSVVRETKDEYEKRTITYANHLNSMESDFKKKDISFDECSFIIDTATDLLESDSYSSIVLGLCILTGRRFIEIMKLGKFEILPENKLLFLGQAKKNNPLETIFIIPVLNDNKRVFDALTKLRKMKNFDGVDNKKINSNYAKTIDKKLQKLFSRFGLHKIHDCRKFYACLCNELYKPKNIKQTAYMASILGHDVTNPLTTQAYISYNITS